MAIQNDLAIFRGEDVGIGITLVPAVDITGWSISFILKANYSGPAITTKTVGSGITITDAAAGQFTVSLLAADTVSLPAGRYYYDVARTTPGARSVLSHGEMQIRDNTVL